MNDIEWNESLAAFFLSPDSANRPLYLWVDDETLEQVAREQGADCGGNPVADFERSVQLHATPTRLFRTWIGLLDIWNGRGREGIPPFLTALGATVLAASRRGLSKAGAGQASYYKQIWKIFGQEREGIPDFFDSDVPRMWRVFNNWLLNDRGGALGLPTAEPPEGYWPYIGWAVSQALLTGYDRSNLTRFFVSIGVEPGTELSVDEALLRFVRWERSGGEVSHRLRTALSDSVLQRHVGKVIVSQLARWDGSARDQVGRRILPIVTTLDAGRGRRLGLAVLVPPNFPHWIVDSPAGPLDLDNREGFAIVPIDVSGRDLEEGLKWSLEGVTLEMPGRSVIPFSPDDRMNRWSSVDRVERGREHFVLVRSSVAAVVEALLSLRAPEARRTTRLQIPEGWVAFRGVIIENQNPRVPAGLESLVPRPREIPGLTGGLRLVSDRRIYLTDGAPNLVVPGVGGHPLAVRVDGDLIAEVSSDLEVIRLADLGLRCGTHQVEVESLRMNFTLLDRLQEHPTDAILGHRLRKGPSAWVVSSPPGELEGDSDVEISGASLHQRGDLLPTPADSFMVKADAGRHLAVKVDLDVVPLASSQPDWASSIGLPFNAFELEPLLHRAGITSGEVWWVVRLFAHKAQLIHLTGGSVDDVTSVPSSFSDLVVSLRAHATEFVNATPDEISGWTQLIALAESGLSA